MVISIGLDDVPILSSLSSQGHATSNWNGCNFIKVTAFVKDAAMKLDVLHVIF